VIVLRTNPSNQYDDDVRDHFTFRYIFFLFSIVTRSIDRYRKKNVPIANRRNMI